MTNKYEEWRDLFKHQPDASLLEEQRATRGHPAVGSKVQKMSDAQAPKINIDHYKVEVTRTPNGMTANKLFEHIRINLNDFIDNSNSTFEGYTSGDNTDWQGPGGAKLGGLMLFKIQILGFPLEQAAVITSLVSESKWIFSPVTIGIVSPGEHPVSGNREFGFVNGGSTPDVKFTFYTRAVDRAIDNLLPPPSTVYSGGHELWVSLQEKISSYVNSNGGDAQIISPVAHRPDWNDEDVQEILN